MKNLNNYKEFLNENIKDFLQPKSKEEVLKSLQGNPNTKFKSTKGRINDGGLRGIVPAYYEDLVKLFGEPFIYDNDEGNIEWTLKSSNNNILFIYDYERHITTDKLKTQLYEWHIGGRSSSQEDANDLIAYIIKNTR